jgi:hypothetical protein
VTTSVLLLFHVRFVRFKAFRFLLDFSCVDSVNCTNTIIIYDISILSLLRKQADYCNRQP